MAILASSEKILETYLDFPLIAFKGKSLNYFVGYMGTLGVENSLGEYSLGREEY